MNPKQFLLAFSDAKHVFLASYLAVQQSTLSQRKGDNVTRLILVTVCYYSSFWPEDYCKPFSEFSILISVNPPESFEWASFLGQIWKVAQWLATVVVNVMYGHYV